MTLHLGISNVWHIVVIAMLVILLSSLPEILASCGDEDIDYLRGGGSHIELVR